MKTLAFYWAAVCCTVLAFHIDTAVALKATPLVSDSGFNPIPSNNSATSTKQSEGALKIFLFSLSAAGIPKKDPFGGKADPFVVVSWAPASSEAWAKLYTTKPIADTSEPKWPDTITFSDYNPGEGQVLRFEVRDEDPGNPDDAIGWASITIDDCVNYRKLRFVEGDSQPQYSCVGEISGNNGNVYLTVLSTQ